MPRVNDGWPSYVDFGRSGCYREGVSRAGTGSASTLRADARTGAGAHPRSEHTRELIVQAARAQFAARGYHRTTIRSVAAAARIDPAMVIRYFRNKAGLFQAAMARTSIPLPDLGGAAPGRLGETVVGFFMRRWDGNLADDPLAFLLRSAVTDEVAARRFRTAFSEQIEAPVAAAIGGDDAERRVALTAAQLLGLALCRHILRLEPIASMDPGLLRTDLAATVEHYLAGRLAGPPAREAGSQGEGTRSLPVPRPGR